MSLRIERMLFGDIPRGVADPAAEGHYSVVGRYFHNMHSYATYVEQGEHSNFHPIAACIKAIGAGFFGSLMGSFLSFCASKIITPKRAQMHLRIGLEGAPWVYAASIIYTGVKGWSQAIADHNPHEPPSPRPSEHQDRDSVDSSQLGEADHRFSRTETTDLQRSSSSSSGQSSSDEPRLSSDEPRLSSDEPRGPGGKRASSSTEGPGGKRASSSTEGPGGKRASSSTVLV